MIYDNFIKLLPPDTKRNTILKQTQKARSIYKLFEKIGIDKIRYITTYSANSIAELSDSQVQTIIDYFSKNPDTELHDDQDDSIIDSFNSENNSSDNDQNNTSEVSRGVWRDDNMYYEGCYYDDKEYYYDDGRYDESRYMLRKLTIQKRII